MVVAIPLFMTVLPSGVAPNTFTPEPPAGTAPDGLSLSPRPLALMVVISFWTTRQFQLIPTWTLENYVKVFTTPVYMSLLLKTVRIAAGVSSRFVVTARTSARPSAAGRA